MICAGNLQYAQAHCRNFVYLNVEPTYYLGGRVICGTLLLLLLLLLPIMGTNRVTGTLGLVPFPSVFEVIKVARKSKKIVKKKRIDEYYTHRLARVISRERDPGGKLIARSPPLAREKQ